MSHMALAIELFKITPCILGLSRYHSLKIKLLPHCMRKIGLPGHLLTTKITSYYFTIDCTVTITIVNYTTTIMIVDHFDDNIELLYYRPTLLHTSVSDECTALCSVS